MENKVISKITLISPILGSPKYLSETLKNLESFFSRFPVKWQWILTQTPNSSSDHFHESLSSTLIEIQLIKGPRKQSRSEAVFRGLTSADGDLVLILPCDLSIPLAEAFSFLQEMIMEPSIDMIVGQRGQSKKMNQNSKTSWHLTLDKILTEKNQFLKIPDPLCPLILIRQEALQRIRPELKKKSWYYSLEILKAARELNLKIVSKPVACRDPYPSQIPLLKEYFRNFF